MKIEIDGARWAKSKKIAKGDRLPVASILEHMLDFAIECSEPDMDAEAVGSMGRTDLSAAPHG